MATNKEMGDFEITIGGKVIKDIVPMKYEQSEPIRHGFEVKDRNFLSSLKDMPKREVRLINPIYKKQHLDAIALGYDNENWGYVYVNKEIQLQAVDHINTAMETVIKQVISQAEGKK